MRGRRHTAVAVAAVAATTIILSTLTGCGPGISEAGADEVAVADAAMLELECEGALQHLSTVIQAKSADASFSRASIIEATALRDAATELYTEGEFRIALELIDEALSLLGEK